MKKRDIAMTIAIVALLCLVCYIFCEVFRQQASRQRHYAVFEDFLHSTNAEIVKGIVRSPAVIIELDEVPFLDKIAELNASTVYQSQGMRSDTFYVFTSDFNIAYSYTIGRW